MRYSNLESEYLVSLIRSAIKQEPFVPVPDGLDIDALLNLAVEQQVSSMIYSVLADNNVLDESKMTYWNNVCKSEIQKTIVVNNERSMISADLEEQGIDYMYLKGIVIKNYYPKTSMRQMSDNDILYHEKDRNALLKIMRSHSYVLGASAGISDDFYKKPFSTFEFHRTLFNPEEPFCPEFNPWERATVADGTKHCYCISSEDNYIYAVSHLYKHYYCIDGCGIRFLCDLYLLIHSDDNLDFDYIDSVFERFGITEFAQTALGLAEALFADAQSNDKQQDLLDFMFSGGVYGKSSFDINEELEKYHNSKLLYLLHRAFPPVKMMKGNYKILEKHIYLLPIIYIVRLVQKYKYNRNKLEQEIETLKNTND